MRYIDPDGRAEIYFNGQYIDVTTGRPSAQQSNTFTISRPNGEQVTLNRPKTTNPVVPSLLKQNDTQFSSRPNLQSSGCNFRTAQSWAEMTLGVALSAAQIIELWDSAITNGSMTANGTVSNPDLVANAAAEKLGRSDIRFTFGWIANDRSVQIGEKLKGTTELGNWHHIPATTDLIVIWDTYNPSLVLTNPKGVHVYVYATNEN
jgi:hypothetical protein